MEGIQQMAAVVCVLGLLLATLWWLKRRGLAGNVFKAQGSRKLAYLERVALGPQHALHLVRVGERAFLLTSFANGCSLVESFPWRDLESPDGSAE
jgi:flagellar biogenesis protein FliO